MLPLPEYLYNRSNTEFIHCITAAHTLPSDSLRLSAVTERNPPQLVLYSDHIRYLP